MSFTVKLDLLMKEKHITKAELSRQANIPYTTIDGFYKKGTDNIKLSTLKRLCTYFNCSLDYLAIDESEERYIVLNDILKTNDFNEDELAQIYDYALYVKSKRK